MTAFEWNARHPIGTRVRFRRGPEDRSPLVTTTRSIAWELVRDQPVVLLKGHAGHAPLDSLEVL